MGCASVGTSLGRIAHLQHSESQEPSAPAGALFPDAVMPEDNGKLALAQVSHTWSPGMVRAFNSRYIGVLQRDRGSIQVLDLHQDLAEVGALKLPVQASIDGFCAGGGHVYVLSQGDATAKMWRFPLPSHLDL